MDKKEIKAILYKKCEEFVNERIKHIQQALDEAMESGIDQTKSSSGDKHETGRAQMHLEQEKNSKQLSEALLLRDSLAKLDVTAEHEKIGLGSLVITDKGNFYIAIAAGKMEIENEFFYVISPASPLGVELKDASVGDVVEFNRHHYKIKEIY